MGIATELRKDFNQILAYAEQVRIKYYNKVFIGDYDDDIQYTQSGTDIWISGLPQPLDTKDGGYDALLLQQGLITLNDKKLYIAGSVDLSGTARMKIGMTGSPPTREYEVIDQGQIIEWHLDGVPIYKKLYIRYLNNGSFAGE